MRSTPWRTVALCAATAVLAGAGSAALADSGAPDPAAGAAPGKATDAQLMTRKCMIARNDEAPHEVTCPPGGKPPGGKPPGGGGCFVKKLETADGKVHVVAGREAGATATAEADDVQAAQAAKADAVKAQAAKAAGA
ncbi:MAG: hypothetical protein QOD69_870 [Solirubrobacteraceae bacterium]|jgi:hypothetical protein|nr:hypothetical protein [Solirubrobacteraceae bacterium]